MLWSAADPAGITKNPSNTESSVRPPDQGVEEQLADPGSLLNYYIAILALKAEHPDIMYGAVTERFSFDNRAICAFRAGGVIVMHNLSGEAAEVDISNLNAGLRGHISPTGELAELQGGMLTIAPYATVVLS
jgi:hypothetical protein